MSKDMERARRLALVAEDAFPGGHVAVSDASGMVRVTLDRERITVHGDDSMSDIFRKMTVPRHSQLDELQKEHWRWMEEVHAILGTEPDVQMRLRRFAEEAAELCQAGGLDFITFMKVVTDAYSRPVGEFPQEIGGTMVTLLCLAAAKGQSVDECARREFTRIDTPEMKQKIADKQAIKAQRGI